MKFIIGFLITIGLLIFVFVLIFRGVSDRGTTPANQASQALVSYADSSTVTMQLTTEGPVSADQTHDAVRITVGRDNTTIDVFKGYDGNIVKTQTYPNNSVAYADFLRAIDFAGFTQGDKSKDLTDTRGRCSTGYRYIMQIEDGSSEKQKLWATSCSSVATFKGKVDVVRQLFKAQVPDYDKVTAGYLNL